MTNDPNRWEGVYQTKEEVETSWFEDRPQVSLDLIAATCIGTGAAIVDVGAGASRLVDCLLERGFQRITVLDLSETALCKGACASAQSGTGRVGGGECAGLAALAAL